MYAGDSCKMGSTVVRGEVEGTVEFTGKNTFFGKTATMLQGDNELGHLQKILLKVRAVNEPDPGTAAHAASQLHI